MNPDDMAVFRYARLLLLLDLVQQDVPEGIDAERLAVYDFLAVHPLLLARDPDDPDRLALLLAGFDDRALAYASAGQRLATAQQHLTRDLTMLVRWEMVSMAASGRIRYRLTAHGRETAHQLTAAYAHSYTTAARIVTRRLRRLSGRKLREALRRCITAVPINTAVPTYSGPPTHIAAPERPGFLPSSDFFPSKDTT